ncbi:MAG: HDIG domain-containing metalloprotein [Bacillota bacterium]
MLDIRVLFKEFDEHLLKDEQPSVYFKKLLATGIYFKQYPFTMLGELVKIQQQPDHHPEGNVWNHTMLVVDNAALRRHLSEDARAFMWAALLHDLGKAPTTKLRKGKITSYDHDKIGEKLSLEFISALTDDTELIKRVPKLVRWHMQTLFVVKDLPFADIHAMLKEVSLNEIAMLSTCDRLGRGAMTQEKVQKELENIRIFIDKCSAYNIEHLRR